VFDTPEVRRFRATVRLAAEGMALMRQNLRRRFPDESEAQIDGRLTDWLDDRPMDTPGPIVAR